MVQILLYLSKFSVLGIPLIFSQSKAACFFSFFSKLSFFLRRIPRLKFLTSIDNAIGVLNVKGKKQKKKL